MLKLRVSYERPEDLRRLINRLGSDIKRIRTPRHQEGKYKRVYIELKS